MWFFSRPKIETEDTCNIKTTSENKDNEEKDFVFVYDVNNTSVLGVCGLVDMGLLGYGADYNDIIRIHKPNHSIKDGTYIVMNRDGSFENTSKYKWLAHVEYDYLTKWKNEAEAKADK